MLRPAVIGPLGPPELHVMTWNVRRRADGLAWRTADRWSNRAPRVRALLHTERPTLLGMQELLPSQLSAVAAGLGARHRFVGHGRRPGRRGEGCPIFFDTSRLELIGWEQLALSDTPHQPGSISWGNPMPRVMVGATFRDRATAATFTAVNLHLDPVSAPAQLRSVELVRAWVEEAGLPAVVMGDFNAGPGSPTYDRLLRGGLLHDAWPVAAHRLTPEWGTYTGYRAPREGGRRLAWIAVTPDITVERVAIHARPIDGGQASDHLPVQTVVRMPEGSRP